MNRSQPKQEKERLPGSTGLLSQSWRDALAIVGAVGAAITTLALVVAIWQMWRTATAAKASTEAAVTAYNESRGSYSRHVMTLMARLLSEAELHVENQNWEVAEMRLRDIFDQILQLSGADPPWREFADRVDGMRGSFERVRKGEIQFKSLRSKWRRLVAELRKTLSGLTGPFRATEGGMNT
jgi:hypothetical protein